MKSTRLTMIMLFLVVVYSEQPAAGATIEGEINTQDGKYFTSFFSWGGRAKHIYAGDYTVKLLVGNENLGCSLRIGTKSSNTRLLTISGPLAVRNVTDPVKFLKGIGRKLIGRSSFKRLPFKCGTAGKIQVSDPPTVLVPVKVTLTYGPFLKRTRHFLVTQKMGIKSASASPARRYYTHNQRVSLTLTPTRKISSQEFPPHVYWRVREGELCRVSFRADDRYGATYSASNKWRLFGTGSEFFREGKSITQYARLCQRGRTLLEFGFPNEEITAAHQRIASESRITRLALTVPNQGTKKKRRIRSRGIDNAPPLMIPDPIPPALPNFELQGESAKEK